VKVYNTPHRKQCIVTVKLRSPISLYAVSYWPEWTTATQCCAVSAALKLSGECKTVQPGSFSRLKDDLMPSHYCVSCIGCQFNTEASTRWLCWPSRVAAAPQHRHTSVVSSKLESVNEHFTRLQYHYWTSRSPGDFARRLRRAFRCAAPTAWN